MATRILVTDGMDAGAIETLRKDGYEIVEKYYEPDELGAALKDFDAVIIRSATKIREAQIDACKGGKLQLIVRAGVGMDNIDIKYAEAAGITVKNTPNSSANAVAELALAHLFSTARNISIAGHTMREQKWEKKVYSKGYELSGKTICIFGFGRIGTTVGIKCKALGMNVLAYDPFADKMMNKEKEVGMKFVSQEEAYEQADIICMCAPSGDKPIVDADNLKKMKDGVVIINVSRGSNVNEEALLDGLKSGKVRAAGLDVYVDEKNPNWELINCPAVSCTPHIGAGTKECQARIGLELVDVIKAKFEG
ncbi:MAG: 3-phosphoglycerate dehydrogenase [Lachnospiraceae bacterium]|nr:3-phosphoglycerate dehydrogenase [Lachnospiraceae bacterium]